MRAQIKGGAPGRRPCRLCGRHRRSWHAGRAYRIAPWLGAGWSSASNSALRRSRLSITSRP